MRRPRPVRLAAVALALAVSTALGVVGTPVANADPRDRKRQVDANIAQLRAQLEDTSATLANAYIALQQQQQQLGVAKQQLADATAAREAAQARDAAIADQLAVARAQEAKAEDQLAKTGLQLTGTQATIGRIAGQAYRSGVPGALAVALDASTPQQLASQLSYVDLASRQQNNALARLKVQEADNRNTAARLEAVRAQIADLKKQAEQAVRDAEAAEQRASAARDQIQQLTDAAARNVAIVEAEKVNEQAQLDQAQAESDQLTALLAELARQALARGGSPGGNGTLSHPANGPITSGFGMRYHPVLHIWRLHAGVDFGVGCGTPLYAAAAGTVVRASMSGGAGNQVIIDHGVLRGAGVATVYDHLSQFSVGAGQHVNRGQLIGYSGTTGLSTGCHLHFEVHVNGAAVNPMGWL